MHSVEHLMIPWAGESMARLSQQHWISTHQVRSRILPTAGRYGPPRRGPTLSAGSFVWLDLITVDIKGAQSFYCPLLGWTVGKEEMDGRTFEFGVAGGQYVCGFMASGEADAPSYWLPLIEANESVQFAADTARQSGGKVISGPTDYPGMGTMATIADPDGALFMATSGSGMSKSDAWPPAPGTVSWYALAAMDAITAAAFYSAVFGYDPVENPDLNTPEGNVVLQTGEEMHAGLFSHGGSLPSAWLAYFVVVDIDAAQHRVIELGGTISTPIMTIPEIGRIVSAVDPQGAAFCLHQPE